MLTARVQCPWVFLCRLYDEYRIHPVKDKVLVCTRPDKRIGVCLENYADPRFSFIDNVSIMSLPQGKQVRLRRDD